MVEYLPSKQNVVGSSPIVRSTFKRCFVPDKIDFHEVETFLQKCGPKTRLYLGCDSRVYYTSARQRMVTYTTAIVIHIDGQHGGKLFYENSTEPDRTLDRKKPSMRLMTEVYKVSELYLNMIDNVDSCIDKDIEIHVDINPQKEYKSSAIISEALGYIRGVCQVDAKVKPEAWAASSVADAF